jgi:hypothetical protein
MLGRFVPLQPHILNHFLDLFETILVATSNPVSSNSPDQWQKGAATSAAFELALFFLSVGCGPS